MTDRTDRYAARPADAIYALAERAEALRLTQVVVRELATLVLGERPEVFRARVSNAHRALGAALAVLALSGDAEPDTEGGDQ